MEAQAKQGVACKKKNGQGTNAKKNKAVVKAKSFQQIQMLDISSVFPDPKQPRKTFDEKSLQMLAQSIAEHGVLQPITVRKEGDGHIIVMGERRFRACKLAGQPTIPAIVKEYGDHEIFEVQIIENLQRRDVEPTEEAEAIQFLLERYGPTEIAKRLGRSENYVRQRIKLAGLIEGFKQFVRDGKMTLSLGIAVALFEPGEQRMLLESLEGDFQEHRIKRMVESRTFDLTKSCFDVTDKTLVPKAGSCDVCPFNAANQGNLFGDGKMVCTRTACFENKKARTFIQLLKRVKKDGLRQVPNVSKYWVEEEQNQWVMAQMENQGLEVHLTNELDILNEPVKPTMERIREEHCHFEYTEEELGEFLAEALESFTEEKEAWDNALDNSFDKGILLDTDTYLTHTIFAKVREVVTGESSGVRSLEKRRMAECTPEEQIVKINTRELRKKEIENNNQFKEVVDMIRETDYIDRKTSLTVDEMVAISVSMFENNIGFHDQRKHFERFLGNDAILSKEELVKQFKRDFKKEIFYRLIRFLLTRQVHLGESNHTNNLTNQAFYTAMKPYFKERIVAIEKTYADKCQKREARIKERVKALEEQANALKG